MKSPRSTGFQPVPQLLGTGWKPVLQSIAILLFSCDVLGQPTTQQAPQTLAGESFLSLPGDKWKLSFNDEFTRDSLDKTKWSIGLPWAGTDGEGRHHNDQY